MKVVLLKICLVHTDIVDAIKEHGCIVEYLPPYSPDLSPIEKKWSQAKSVRKRDRCDVDTLFATAF